MIAYATFALGVAAGWLARGTADSSRAAAVTMLATATVMVDRVRRAVAIQRDQVEDLIAEARARADVLRRERPEPRPASAPVQQAAE